MKVTAYVDGFNLYYGLLRDSPYRWLDIGAFARILAPRGAEVTAKYYTAKISARAADPQAPIRQESYLRALRATKTVEIIFGTFLSSDVTMAEVPSGRLVHVRKTEEKGTDVNIGVHMVRDGFLNLFDVALLVSNDNDLTEPVRIVTQELKKQIIVYNPRSRDAFFLKNVASQMRPIRTSALSRSQLPSSLSDEHGQISKPLSW